MDNKRDLLHAVLIDLPFFVLLAAFEIWSILRGDSDFIQVFVSAGTLLFIRTSLRVLRPRAKGRFLFLITITMITTLFSFWLSAWYLPGLIPAAIFVPDTSEDRRGVCLLWPLPFVLLSVIVTHIFGVSEAGGATFILRVIILFVISAASMLWAYGFNRYFRQIHQLDYLLEQASVRSLLEQKYSQELRDKNALIEKNVRLQERARMSRDIHNAAGHTITAALMSLEAAQVLMDTSPEEAKEKIETSSARLKETLQSIRQAIHRVDTEDEQLDGHRFFEQLENALKRYAQDTGTRIRLNLGDQSLTFKISAERAHFLVSSVLELMTNSIRHAGANAFTLLAECDIYNLTLIFQDNGISTDKNRLVGPFSEGFGLSKIRQTLEEDGGFFEVTRDDGFRVLMRIHLRQHNA